MSGFSHEIIIKFQNQIDKNIFNKLEKAITSFFNLNKNVNMKSINNQNNDFRIDFFTFRENKEKYHSFYIETKQIHDSFYFLKLIDNSSSTGLLFWNNSFFNHLFSYFNKLEAFQAMILLADLDYDTELDLFLNSNHNSEIIYRLDKM